MKRLVLAVLVLLAASSATAQEASAVDMTALKAYVTKTLPRCPAGQVAFDPIGSRGPAGFHVYRAVLTSTDEHCSASKLLLYSPASKQVITGSVIALPSGESPVHVRLSDHASKLLKADIKATINPTTLPDGLRQVSLTRGTDFGPFSYTGYLDSSDRFLIVGTRGHLNEDPAATLRKAIEVDKAARRGNSAAKIEIIEISDFQCPSCARAHEALEPLFTKNMSKIRYSRIDLPLFEHHKWAVQAAMGARAMQKAAPAKYWSYVDYIFKNQESFNPATFDQTFRNWVEDNDLSWPAVAKVYQSAAERKVLLDSVSRLFAAGVNSTPTFIVNGQPLGFGDGSYAVQFMKDTLGVK